MFDELKRQVERIREQLRQLGDSLDLPGRSRRVRELEERSAAPGFWEDPDRARAALKELGALRAPLEAHQGLMRRLGDLEELLALAEDEGDLNLARELEAEAAALAEEARGLEARVLLNGPYDGRSAILSLHPGAGGTESQDWAEMLLRMYTRWAERHGFKVQCLDLQEGEEAGIKSASTLVEGENAYGLLKAEKGVHRLVRISPFDASGRRHTSFASVEVLPEIEDDQEVVIPPEDIRVDTFRSSGAGGQHVNKTDSAVRITHLPTGIVVTCQNERSQHSNRETAMKILRARLLERKEEERLAELARLRGQPVKIAWGSQIRSYVFQPYSLVKDHRTGLEVGDVQSVMDGDIDRFILAYLQRAASGGLEGPAAAGGQGPQAGPQLGR
ncbi:MAG: peptide chain release factor 2 [Acetobacteraceae bacterium]|nr:peptide chain release factor 2 [Acetobacteraceae bacterium]